VWEVKGKLPASVARTIIEHLEGYCGFKFAQEEFSLTGEPLDFYGGALLCQLDLPAGCSLKTRWHREQELPLPARFYFLYKADPNRDILVPLSGRRGDLAIAKRWLGLNLDTNALRLAYARFGLHFGRTKKPPRFFNVPRRVHDLRLDPISDQRMWGIYGSLWRFGVNDQNLEVRPHFERRGALWFSRWRAHLPIQSGDELYDVDLAIWDIDGHVTFHPTIKIYRDPALVDETHSLPARISQPGYIRWYETLLAFYRNSQVIVSQLVYVVMLVIFGLAAAVSVLLPLEIYGHRFVRDSLDIVAAVTGVGSWTGWLKAACFYCIGYFALTTMLILDAGTLRSSLLTLSSRFKDSWLDGVLFELERRERRIEHGYHRGFFRRIRTATQRLIAWTLYMICLFTSLQVSYKPELLKNPNALADVWQVFAEQALLYVPVVFYYVGRKSLDVQKLTLVTPWILILLQFWMGLLVIRRIHRFWAATATFNATR
jgi:hypothetical protein